VKQTTKVRLWIWMRNNGDGSASPVFFGTREEAELAAEKDEERLCDDIDEVRFVVDSETGALVSRWWSQ
jgi:hypothetical protein